MWVDLTAVCSVERITNGPYTVAIRRSDANAFSIEALSKRLAVLAANYSNRRLTSWQLDGLTEKALAGETTSVHLAAAPADRLAWNMLCADFGSPDLSADDVASVGLRVAWYYPAVPEAFREPLLHTLQGFTDAQLSRAVGAARVALDEDRPDIAELVADLLKSVPDAGRKLVSFLQRAVLPHEDREAAIQMLEAWDEEPREDLRETFLVGRVRT